MQHQYLITGMFIFLVTFRSMCFLTLRTKQELLIMHFSSFYRLLFSTLGMDSFFKVANEDCVPDLDILRCPFLRNINEPTNFSFASSLAFPVPVSYISFRWFASSIVFYVTVGVLLIICISYWHLQLLDWNWAIFWYYFLLYLIRDAAAKVQFLKMVPILTWHLGFSMGVME